MKICTLLQFHFSDLHKNFDKNNIFKKISTKEYKKRFNPVIISSDQKENFKLKKYSKKYKIPIIFGSPTNLISRIKKVHKIINSDIYVRILPQWYFCDFKKIYNFAEKLYKTNQLILKYPDQFDFRFVGDIFKIEYIKLIDELLKKKQIAFENYYKFNPWSFLVLNEKSISRRLFNIKFNDLPKYPYSVFKTFKAKYNRVWPESWNKSGTPQISYDFAKNYIKKKKSEVLDLACGTGAGTIELSNNKLVNKVLGLDYDIKNIQYAKNNNKSPKTKYETFDAMNLDKKLINKFDVIVSIHTMEHIKDDNKFIFNLYEYLKKNGVLIIEVPFYYTYPFFGIKIPYGDGHFREYNETSFKRVIKTKFNILNFKGVSRGIIGDKIGNAAVIIAKKR